MMNIGLLAVIWQTEEVARILVDEMEVTAIGEEGIMEKAYFAEAKVAEVA